MHDILSSLSYVGLIDVLLPLAGRFIRISVEFVLANPKGGIQFVVPGADGNVTEVCYSCAVKFDNDHHFMHCCGRCF